MKTVALMREYARLLGFCIPPILRASLVVCFLALSACSTMPAGTGFNAPVRAENTLPRKVWIGKVNIADDSVEDKSIVEDSLRGNIAAYIQEAGYFLETGSLPGKVSDDDLVLDFRFDRYIQKRSVHPAHIPLAALTLYLYEIFGGPVYVDESDLSVTLAVHDGAGKSMGNFFFASAGRAQCVAMVFRICVA